MTDSFTQPRQLTIEDLLRPAGSGIPSEQDGYQLIDRRQHMLTIVQALVADDDVDRLTALRDGFLSGHKMLEDASERAVWIRELTDAPFREDDGAMVHAARALAALGLTLVAGPKHLPTFRRWTACTGLAVPGVPVREVPASCESKHVAVIREIAATGELDLISLIWLLALDGQPLNAKSSASTEVLLDLGKQGQHAVLRLSRLPGLPSGLVPDPTTMTLCSADRRFGVSLATAWRASGGESRGTVLWSLSDKTGPVQRVTNESLGLAFTVLLDEQRRTSRRFLGPVTLRRMQSHTAIVGKIMPEPPHAVASVTGYEAKLDVVGDKTRVILPRSDLLTAQQATRSGTSFVPVATWQEAAKVSRRWDRRRTIKVFAAVAVIIAIIAGSLYWLSESQRDGAQRRAIAADLAARAATLRDTDPTLSAKLGLAARAIDPNNARATEAMRDALESNKNVVRTWQADPLGINALAVSEPADSVIASGSEHVTKVWTTSTGRFRGQIPETAYQLAAAANQPIAAATTNNGLALFDIGNQPNKLGALPTASCTKEDETVAMRITHHDSRLVVVWRDGAVNTYDTVTRNEMSCQTGPNSLAPLTINNLPARNVVAADIVDEASVDGRADDEVVLLLTNNDVVSTRTGSRAARIEVNPDQFTGDATLVAASTDTISVATAQGVLVWRRTDHTLMTNPAGGLPRQPRSIAASNGNLLISGTAGTVLVPLGRGGWSMADSVEHTGGGSATIAAINGRSIVAGGAGGRLSVIADSSGELAVGQDTYATATAFRSDGQLVAASAPPSGFGRSATTLSNGVQVIDPRTPATPDRPPLPLWTNGDHVTPFYINDVATTEDLIAAAGQVGRSGAIVVWRGLDRTKATVLQMPQANEEELKPEERIVTSVAFTTDRKLLVARHVSGEVGLWSTDDLHRVGTVALKSGDPRMMVFTDRAVFLEGTDEATQLTEVDLTTRQVIRRVPAPGAVFLSAKADGSRIATMTWDGAVQFWNGDITAQGGPWRPSSSGEQLHDIALDRAGQKLAIAQGTQVQVYDVDTRTLAMPPLPADPDAVVNLAWSPDGDLLAATIMPPVRGNKQIGPLRVWKTGGLDWTSQVCRWAGGDLSTTEWSQYVGDSVAYIDLCAETNK